MHLYFFFLIFNFLQFFVWMRTTLTQPPHTDRSYSVAILFNKLYFKEHKTPEIVKAVDNCLLHNQIFILKAFPVRSYRTNRTYNFFQYESYRYGSTVPRVPAYRLLTYRMRYVKLLTLGGQEQLANI